MRARSWPARRNERTANLDPKKRPEIHLNSTQSLVWGTPSCEALTTCVPSAACTGSGTTRPSWSRNARIHASSDWIAAWSWNPGRFTRNTYCWLFPFGAVSALDPKRRVVHMRYERDALYPYVVLLKGLESEFPEPRGLADSGKCFECFHLLAGKSVANFSAASCQYSIPLRISV